MSFDLQKFLKNYKPKDLRKELDVYLQTRRLHDFTFLTPKNMNNLEPGKTHIKYIKSVEAFVDKKYESHIRYGGILLACGCYYNKKFKKTNEIKEWTHLLLKKQITNENDEEITRIYTLSLKNNYIFLKNYISDQDSFRNYLIELVNNL